jgi:glycosyltransferase involved in cell wall biosynthesis
MPVALLEAMSCGLPAVATAVGGSREVLAGRDLGWLVPPEQPTALAAALAAALSDPAAARARGGAARREVLARYTLERVADAILALYGAVLAQRGRPAPALAAPPSR